VTPGGKIPDPGGKILRRGGEISARARRSICRRLGIAALAVLAVTGVAAPPALADSVQSSNWAGYAAHRGGVKFKRVTATWHQPKAICTPGLATYSSVWVGLGGYSVRSRALEQIGGEVDCNARGRVVSGAWYELVPAPSRTISLQVRPGDEMKATVTVIGHRAHLQLRNLTRRHTFTRTVHTSAVDISSAEWILETPSICSGGSSCQVLPLANFGSATFRSARATTTRNASGPISSRSWNTSKITLAAGGRHFAAAGGAPASVSALPSSLSSRRTSFTIIYQGPATSADPSPAMARTGVRSGALARPRRSPGSPRL
jgi:Peptidase A4 family